MKQPTTPSEALTLALYLAITAPTDEKAAQAVAMAEEVASGLNELEVERCKREASKLAEAASVIDL